MDLINHADIAWFQDQVQLVVKALEQQSEAITAIATELVLLRKGDTS